MANKSEQWLIDGDCEECRRRDYCSTECKKHKVVRNRRNYDILRLMSCTNGLLNTMNHYIWPKL